MRRRHALLFAVLFVCLFAGSAYPLTMSRFFDSGGNPTVFPLSGSGSASSRAISRYAVPEGIELRKDITYEYYPVFGRSYSSIVNSAADNGPFIKGRNVRSPARTDWGLGISYQYDYTYDVDEELRTVRAVIDISDVSVKYNITITLPALLDDSALNPVEKRLWKNYFRRLLEREDGKAAIIRDENTRKEIEDAVKDIKGLSFDYIDEDEVEHSVKVFLGDETDKIGREWVKKIGEKLDEYNREPSGGNLPRQGGSLMKQRP